jgi:hypothetical protein
MVAVQTSKVRTALCYFMKARKILCDNKSLKIHNFCCFCLCDNSAKYHYMYLLYEQCKILCGDRSQTQTRIFCMKHSLSLKVTNKASVQNFEIMYDII